MSFLFALNKLNKKTATAKDTLEINARAQLNAIANLNATANGRYWCVSAAVGRFLRSFVIEKQTRLALEIGTSIGYSALWLAWGLEKTDGHLYTIESHAQRFALAKKHFQAGKLAHRITQIKGHAPEIFCTIVLPAPLDLVFVDGVKKNTVAYLNALLPLLADCSFVIVDNVTSHSQEMTPFFTWLQNRKKNGLTFTIRSDLGSGLAIIAINRPGVA